MTYILETKSLTHHFGKDKVLDEINLQVPAGAIYGFLGPNGAGKTTTLKLVLGLLTKQQGSIEIFGKDFHANRKEILQNIGSLIEAPSLYGHLNAKDNLKIWQRIYNCPKERIDEVLKIVGLSNTGRKKASKFSLGMKQRLSIAIALLHSPKLLILDEPTNGLDPNGILEIRSLLRDIAKDQGVTIVISSHLLSEIEKLVDHLVIIHHGKILFQGTMDELNKMQKESSSYSLETNEPGTTEELLNENAIEFEAIQNAFTIQNTDRESMATLNEKLVNRGVKVYQLAANKNDLESIFMDITNTPS